MSSPVSRPTSGRLDPARDASYCSSECSGVTTAVN